MFCFLTGNSQRSVKIDSLLGVMKRGDNNFSTMYRLSVEFMYYKSDSGYYYSKLALKDAIRLNDTTKIIDAGRVQANLLRTLERYDSSLQVMYRILPLVKLKGTTRQLVYVTNILSVTYTLRAQYDSALTYAFESLTLRKQSGRSEDVAVYLHNIGLIYYKMKHYEKALDYYNQSIEICQTIDGQPSLDLMKVNKGLCLVYLRRYDEGIAEIRSGMNIVFDDPDAPEISIKTKYIGLFGLGVAYYEKRNFRLAEENLRESLKLCAHNQDDRLQADNLVYLARIATASGRKPDARSFLLKAEELASKHGYRELLITIYREFQALYIENERALSQYQKRLISLSDDVYRKSLATEQQKLGHRFLNESNLAILARQTALADIQGRLLQARKRLVIFAFTVATLLVILLSTIFLYSRRQTRNNRDLDIEIHRRTRGAEARLRLLEIEYRRSRIMLETTGSKLNEQLVTVNSITQILKGRKSPDVTLKFSSVLESLVRIVKNYR